MNTMTEIKFVGGQEDGEFHFVDDYLDHMRFYEKLDLDDVSFVGGDQIPLNITRKIITYVRKGDVMVCEE